jgi:hypothetical protein
MFEHSQLFDVMVNPLGTTGAIISPHELPHASSFVELVPFFQRA